MDNSVAPLLDWYLWAWNTAALILGPLLCVWLFGGVLRRLGVRRVSATWAGYLLTLLAAFTINPRIFGRDGFVVFCISGMVWAAVLSARRDSRRRRGDEAAD